MPPTYMYIVFVYGRLNKHVTFSLTLTFNLLLTFALTYQCVPRVGHDPGCLLHHPWLNLDDCDLCQTQSPDTHTHTDILVKWTALPCDGPPSRYKCLCHLKCSHPNNIDYTRVIIPPMSTSGL